MSDCKDRSHSTRAFLLRELITTRRRHGHVYAEYPTSTNFSLNNFQATLLRQDVKRCLGKQSHHFRQEKKNTHQIFQLGTTTGNQTTLRGPPVWRWRGRRKKRASPKSYVSAWKKTQSPSTSVAKGIHSYTICPDFIVFSYTIAACVARLFCSASIPSSPYSIRKYRSK